MWLIIRLHYAYRLLLIYLDHLSDFTSVEAEARSVCCYAAHTRSASTSSQQTRDKHPPSIPTDLRGPTSLARPTKPSNVASCTIANEFLRRRTRLERDPTIRPHCNCEQFGCLKGNISDDASPYSPSPLQAPVREAQLLSATRTPGTDEGHNHQIGLPEDIAHNTCTAPALQCKSHNMWRLGLDTDRMNNSIFAVLRRDPGRPTKEENIAQQPFPQEFDDLEGDESYDTQGGAQEWTANTDHQCGQEATPEICSRLSASFKDETDDNDNARSCASSTSGCRAHQVPTCNKSTSPTSDTTLYESATNSPCVHFKTGSRPWDDVPHAELKYDQVEKREVIQCEKDGNQTPTPVRRHWTRHQREPSTDSPFISARTPLPLRARARTNDGLLQLRANISHDSTVPTGVRRTHRRKISLNIPVKTPTRRPETMKHPNLGNCEESPRRTTVPSDNPSRPLTHEERELEYKHRHTFIGTTSLDDCLEALEVSATHATTKEAVARAFVTLASNEQVHARQSSTKPEGWELVPRVTSEISSIDYVAQLQVKLGSITLRQFLDLIPFDEKGEVGALRVVEAFSAASHLDAQAGVGTGRKARAFRSWMVMQS
ncbi:hypothetical protein T440DRAFT_399861 [Plenodomus tracheiphilus IPT5]|uniref:Uncharacterized protein n=1 Tax=Plenodomus tracheiphilus IPT5 TaxID=1408161 RepID=A0A6A7B0P8_9PLEO|nr:hypothetical protein T440DRAFT_399861 [Plenodomus tracheiphilus IPT5]